MRHATITMVRICDRCRCNETESLKSVGEPLKVWKVGSRLAMELDYRGRDLPPSSGWCILTGKTDYTSGSYKQDEDDGPARINMGVYDRQDPRFSALDFAGWTVEDGKDYCPSCTTYIAGVKAAAAASIAAAYVKGSNAD